MKSVTVREAATLMMRRNFASDHFVLADRFRRRYLCYSGTYRLKRRFSHSTADYTSPQYNYLAEIEINTDRGALELPLSA